MLNLDKKNTRLLGGRITVESFCRGTSRPAGECDQCCAICRLV